MQFDYSAVRFLTSADVQKIAFRAIFAKIHAGTATIPEKIWIREQLKPNTWHSLYKYSGDYQITGFSRKPAFFNRDKKIASLKSQINRHRDFVATRFAMNIPGPVPASMSRFWDAKNAEIYWVNHCCG